MWTHMGDNIKVEMRETNAKVWTGLNLLNTVLHDGILRKL
jgi:hypothetical protein